MTTKISAALAILVALAAPHVARAEWYVSHVAGDACVPLNDLDRHFYRRYYGNGELQTPSDFAAAGARIGVPLRLDPRSRREFVVYEGYPDGTQTFFMFFTDRSLCRSVMDTIER